MNGAKKEAVITTVYVDIALLILKFDLYHVLCADFRNVISFVLSHTIFF